MQNDTQPKLLSATDRPEGPMFPTNVTNGGVWYGLTYCWPNKQP